MSEIEVEALSNIPTANWPHTLRTLMETLEVLFRRRGRDDASARREAEEAACAIATYLGGRPLYLPNVSRLKAHLRREAIWQAFTGKNHQDLAEQFGVTLRYIQTIVKERYEDSRRS